jgi:gluconolactonase
MALAVVCDGLAFPEGPIAMADGSVLLVEIRAGHLTRVRPDGGKAVVAQLGGGPNGAALGPDGLIYVCNNGGFRWVEDGSGNFSIGGKAEDYAGGVIQRVCPRSGAIDVLYKECDGRPLSAPNDIVFDREGGFWFTDPGASRATGRDYGALY